MSILKFNPHLPSIILNTYLEGKIKLLVKFVLDTGASYVVIPWRIATGLGLEINQQNLVSTTTASSVEHVPYTSIPKLTVLDKTVRNVPCIVKDLPSESGVDGLLGLSFLKHFKLTIDFNKGFLSLD
ncbi:hypothetical protein A3D78_06165 [Candidatus Gottesmanbacteria bacterium RIFCSPHIGHO2_02_FULL_39_14]|uniref:Peptidase A2 domain-containing protein n=1 Tax=Candidatus Gottesmanbacteria bacterium RIFCSPHIGHO2_02_FULL_39_14 TaxID=1798383 RepID=A0A1F6A3W1_9BACT|nr:MAG: hypothetical protein A3D78_06165 [Candidatus Gottesmanbacteria bacterium RIFCSPHIGHO2_02_FULL_39_14]